MQMFLFGKKGSILRSTKHIHTIIHVRQITYIHDNVLSWITYFHVPLEMTLDKYISTVNSVKFVWELLMQLWPAVVNDWCGTI